MGSWTRTPAFPGRVHRLLAVAVAAGCWLAVPSGASAQQGPALNVSGLTSAATSTVANAGSAVEATVTAAAPVAGPAQDAVMQVAGTVGRVTGPEGPVARVGAGAAKATEPVVERVTRTAPPVADVVKRVAPEAQPAVDDTLQTVTGTVRSAGHYGGGAGAAPGPGRGALLRVLHPALPRTADRLARHPCRRRRRPELGAFRRARAARGLGARGGRFRRIVRRRRIGELPPRRAGAAASHAVSGGTGPSPAPPTPAGHGMAGGVRPAARATRLAQPALAVSRRLAAPCSMQRD